MIPIESQGQGFRERDVVQVTGVSRMWPLCMCSYDCEHPQFRVDFRQISIHGVDGETSAAGSLLTLGVGCASWGGYIWFVSYLQS